jgi:hypothetical protein
MPERHYKREDAAIMVLRLSKQAMTPSEIVEVGAKNGFFENTSRSVIAATNTAIYQASQRPHAPVVRLGNGRYGLPERGSGTSSDKSTRDSAGPAWQSQAGAISRSRRRLPMVDKAMNQRIEKRMTEIEGYIQGLESLSPDRVCLLIEFCHLMELHEHAVELYQRLNRDEVDKEWLMRIQRLVRVSSQYVM